MPYSQRRDYGIEGESVSPNNCKAVQLTTLLLRAGAGFGLARECLKLLQIPSGCQRRLESHARSNSLVLKAPRS